MVYSKLVNIDYLDKVQVLKASDYNVKKCENAIQKDKKVLLCISPAWIESPEPVKHARSLLVERNLVHHVVRRCNVPEEEAHYRNSLLRELPPDKRSCVDLLFCNNNSFVDEAKFRITDTDEDGRHLRHGDQQPVRRLQKRANCPTILRQHRTHWIFGQQKRRIRHTVFWHTGKF